jgi:hypothetical protein
MNAPERPPMGEAQPVLGWSERNQQWLTLQLAALGARIEAFAAMPTPATGDSVNDPIGGPAIARASCDDDFTPALDRCSDIFGLSPFERELLLLTAGVELDSGLRRAVIRAQATLADGGRSSQPTFLLALRVLAQPHWDALSPLAPLRRWRLIELEGRRSPAQQPLHIDERILHYLTGVVASDERLRGVARFEAAARPAIRSTLGQRIARGLSSADRRAALVLLTQLRPEHDSLRNGAMEGLQAGDTPGLWLHARDLPAEPHALAETALLVDRESALAGAVVVIELDPAMENPAEAEQRALAFVAYLLGPVLLLGTPDSARLARLADRRIAKIAVSDLPAQAVEAKIRQQLPAGAAEALAGALQQFRLSPTALQFVIEQVSLDESVEGACDHTWARRIWQCCRESARGGLDALAQRVDSHARFNDVVLPPTQMMMLRDIAEHLRYRHTVYDAWGMAGKSTRGHGLCALFTGESGTGKTLAAEAIANEVGLDLYRIDLATVVSKYIGETEKNLKRLFDGAEASGAVLLFDEADALFGKRSEVKDSHDRYANIEVAYLLQRIEAYRGLAILTTNLKSALDRAFLRRIRFVVQFPFPDDAARREIWRRELPDTAPTFEIDYAALARLQLTGGHIRSVALNAAFMAAAAGEPITMPRLRLAVQREAAKLERTLAEAAPRSFT